MGRQLLPLSQKRDRARRYQGAAFHTISASVPVAEWLAFCRAVDKEGTTMHAVIRNLAAWYTDKVLRG